ncbi:MAG: hypothetical protein AMXMBFR7_17560 [Planctomycetota bacterium]
MSFKLAPPAMLKGARTGRRAANRKRPAHDSGEDRQRETGNGKPTYAFNHFLNQRVALAYITVLNVCPASSA